MHNSILTSLSAFCLAGALFGAAASAEPKAPTEEENADANFAKSLLGTAYDSDLDVQGWTDFGGGLVSPPVYVRHYQREDGTSLILTSKHTPNASTRYVVIDALLISKPWAGYAISLACPIGEDFTLRFIGEARGPDEKEWWTEVRRAWDIEIEPLPAAEPETDTETAPETESAPEPNTEPKREIGTLSKADTKGIKCTNPNW